MDKFKIEALPGNHEGIRIIRMSGSFTIEGVFRFESIFREGDVPVTLIDLTDVSYMDSAAFGAVAMAHTTSERNQRKYALVGASERLRNLFRIAGLDPVLVKFPSIQEAQDNFAKTGS